MLFISYAHSDGAELAQRLQADLARAEREAWLDRTRLTAGASWSVEIERAIDRCDAVLALLSAGSFASDICRAEVLRALRKKKRVLVLRLADGVDSPLFLETRQYVSFDGARPYADAFRQLTAAIDGADTATLAPDYEDTYVTAPPLPATIVPRPEELQSLREGVLRDGAADRMSVASLVGMGGLGKTTVAQMLCRDPVLKDAYPDGIIWVQLGENVSDLVPKMREVGIALHDDPKHYATLDGARNQLRTILPRKAALIVLDDVWTLDEAQSFLADAPASCLLITTRDRQIGQSLKARPVTIPPLSEAQSLAVLAKWTDIPVAQLPPEAAEIVRECGRLPLALAMVGGLVHGDLTDGRADAWAEALRRLRDAQLDEIQFPLENYPHREIVRAIQVSVDTLKPPFRDRYLTMGVFPDDVPVPEAALRTVWGVDESAMRATIRRWLDASLARRDADGRIALHDLQMDYVRKMAPQDLAAQHRHVVDRYAASCGGAWAKGPDDGYFFHRIAWHMANAESWRELVMMLLDAGYIRAKLDRLSYLELAEDFFWRQSCMEALDNGDDRFRFRRLASTVRQLTGFIGRKAETAEVERWMEHGRGSCLMIHGRGGSGKTMLLRHLWVRTAGTAALVRLDAIPKGEDILPALVRELASQDSSLAAVAAFARDAPAPAIVDGLRSALAHSRTRGWVFVADVHDTGRSDSEQHQFVDLVVGLQGIVRFVLAGRHVLDRLVAVIPHAVTLHVAELPRHDVALLIREMFRSRGLPLQDDVLEAIISRSQGNPFVVSLMADWVAEGASLDDLKRPAEDTHLLERVIGRLGKAGITEEALQALTALLLGGQEVTWTEARTAMGVAEEKMQALLSMAFVAVSPGPQGTTIRLHPEVLDALRRRYGLAERGPEPPI